MEDIEQRGLPLYLRAYLNAKLNDNIEIDRESFKEVPNDLKECVDCIVEGKAVPDPSILASYPIYFKEEIIEEVEEHGGSKCKTPVASPVGGTYNSAQTIALTCATDGATIYYTTDGSDPTSESTEYTSEITISTTTTLKAIAVKEGLDNSSILTSNYTIAEVIYTMELDEVYEFLTSLPENTVNTPYKLNITNTTVDDWYTPSDDDPPICYALNANRYVDISYTTVPSELTQFYRTLEGCYISKPPTLPNGITITGESFRYCKLGDMSSFVIPNTVTYLGCMFGDSDLVETPIVHANGNTQIDIGNMFEHCTSLTTVRFDGCNFVPFSKWSMPFIGCTSLQTIYVNTPADKVTLYNMCHEADPTDAVVTLEKIVVTGTEIYTVDINDAYDLLESLPENTSEYPYKLNIINTTASQWSTTGDNTTEITDSICYDKYIDLSPTTLPEGITSISNAFYSNSYVVRSPIIPNTVTDASMAFASSAITELPEIPSSVTNLYLAFNRNEMTTAPVIYANTQTEVNGTHMFMDCSNLTTVRFVGSNINLYDNYNYAFSGCTALTTIYVETAEDKAIIYNKCHTADSSDSIVTEAKIVVDPINNSGNNNNDSVSIK